MSSSTSTPANRCEPAYPKGWVETKKTCEILESLDERYKNRFMDDVADLNDTCWSSTKIEKYYREFGYTPREEWRDPETGMGLMAEFPTSPQPSGDPRQARPSHEIGGNAGKKRDSDDSYARKRGSNCIYSPRPRLEDRDYLVQQRGSNCIYAPRPRPEDKEYLASQRGSKGIYAPRPESQGPASGTSSLPWSSMPYPQSTTGHQQPYYPSSSSHYNHSGSSHGSSYGSPSDKYPSYQAGVPPSNHRYGSVSAPYGSDEGYSYGSDGGYSYGSDAGYSYETDWSGSAHVDSHSGSPQGRASGASEQGGRSSGRARR